MVERFLFESIRFISSYLEEDSAFIWRVEIAQMSQSVAISIEVARGINFVPLSLEYRMHWLQFDENGITIEEIPKEQQRLRHLSRCNHDPCPRHNKSNPPLSWEVVGNVRK